MRTRMTLATTLLLAGIAACGDEGGTGTNENPLIPCTDEPGVICTWAGSGAAGFDGDGRNIAESRLYWPVDMTFASNGDIYVLDWNNHRVRRVNGDETFETVVGTDFVGDGPEDLSDLTAPGALGTTVTLNHPTQFVELPDGTFMLVSWHNHKLRQYDPATGLVTVTCGRGAGYAGDGGPASAPETRLNQPASAVIDSAGGIYILDQRNQRVRYIGADDTISTVVGVGACPPPSAPQPELCGPGFSGDGGSPLEAQLSLPPGSNPPPAGGVALDAEERLYIADTLNHRIRRVDFAADLIETVAGNGTATFGGDGGDGTAASINNPRDIEFGPDGRLYIADELNNRVRALDIATGTITTVAGNGNAEYSGDGELATGAGLNRPAGIAFNDGYLFIADTLNNRIRRIALED